MAIARLISAEGEQLPLVQADDLSTELRLLSDHRDNLVAECTRLINQLHAQMLQIDPCYMERSGVLTTATGVRYCHDLVLPHADGVVLTRLLIVHQLAGQILGLREEIETIETALRQRVQETDTPLLQLCGVGTLVAARLIGELAARRGSALRQRSRRWPGSRQWRSRRAVGTGIGSIGAGIGS